MTSTDRHRWALRQRFHFIELLLFQHGEFNRLDLRAKFGISTPQVSSDIAAFKRAFPNRIKYDAKKKRFVAGRTYKKPDGRDTSAAADTLMRADDAYLRQIVIRDPSMIRDVAAALIYERAI